MFKVNERYTKTDIYKILKVPTNQQKGNWNTGYTKYKEYIYIFANIGVAGRTGVNHNNHWDGDELIWHSKPTAKIGQPLMKELLSSKNVLVFTRENSRDPFAFEGHGIVKKYFNESPIKIRWSFEELDLGYEVVIPEEIKETNIYEGAYKTIKVNVYERSGDARKKCIEHWGCHCYVCKFDFSLQFPSLKKKFIHVHHKVPISTIKKSYKVDPIKDLIPVCPNCHAMIHSRNPAYTIEEIKKHLGE
jgi:5-methylcytosine-specific restriction protein A